MTFMKQRFDYNFYSLININFHFQSIRHEMKTLKEFVTKNNIAPQAILDVGCGDGWITEKLQKLFGVSEIAGLDINQRLLIRAEKKGIRCIKADMERVVPDTQYDLVITYGVLHHAEDTTRFVKNLKRLSSRYILIVDNTVRDSWWHKLTGAEKFIFESSPFHIRSVPEITQAITAAGCELVDVHTNRNANIWHDRSFVLAQVT